MKFVKNILSVVRGCARSGVVAMAALCAAFAAATAQAATIELLTNGEGTTLDGWANTYSGSNSKFEIWTNDYGGWFASRAFDCQLSQTVTLADYGLSANSILVTASGIVWAGNGSKVCNVKVYELDASGNVLATHVIMNRPGEEIKDPGETYSATFSLLPGTGKLKYELNGHDANEWDGTWGPRFKDCSLMVGRGTIKDKQIVRIDSNTSVQGAVGESVIDVEENARAVIDIARGATLTVSGGDASGTNGAAPAIRVPASSTLYIVGEGMLIATGGAAANGGNGSNGDNAAEKQWDREEGTYLFLNGAGGDGGSGGGGAGAGIGGGGGGGAAAGSGAARSSSGRYSGHKSIQNNRFPADGEAGGAGANGSDGNTCGNVFILGNVSVTVTGGAAGASGSGSRTWGNYESEIATDDWFAGGGGPGGGGGGGGAAMSIGGGGGGGGAGGGGGSGSYVVVDNANDDLINRNVIRGGFGGNGGGGTVDGGGTKSTGEASSAHSNYEEEGHPTSFTGAGGDGGNGGAQGGGGGLYALSTVTLAASPSRDAEQPTALSGDENIVASCTVTFWGNGVSVGTATANLMFAPPPAPSAQSLARDGYEFLGFYTEVLGGTQIYDADCNPVYPVWQTVDDVILYARWTRTVTITFDLGGTTLDTVDCVETNGVLPSVAPTVDIDGVRFLGFWTEATGGSQIYDGIGAYVGTAWIPPSNVTLYAHLDPVKVTFKSEGASDVTREFTLSGVAMVPPTAPSVSRVGYRFGGYFRDDVKYYDENLAYVAAAGTVGKQDFTLIAKWAIAYDFSFVSSGAAVGTISWNKDDAAPTAPIPTRTGDYRFLGYYAENGAQVFDENGALVEGSLADLPWEVTLNAQWARPEGSVARLVYRGQLTKLGSDDAPDSGDKYEKTMHFRVYDDESAETPLWKLDNQTVTVNKDGSFTATFGDDTLAELIATGSVAYVGVAIGASGIELKPRRALRPVAAVNRALVAEAAAKDPRIGNLVTENALVAGNVTVSMLEVEGTVTAPGAGKVDVAPVIVGERETLTLLRGDGVNVFAKNRIDLGSTSNVQRGQKIGSRTAPSDGIALITSSRSGSRGLRIPGVIQYCREGEWVRAPASEPDGVKVTFFPFVGK